jgi:hypothetical protein
VAGDLSPLDEDAANVLSLTRSERILQDHVGRTQDQRRSAYWTRLRQHAAGPVQRQQDLRGVHVALRPGPPLDGVYR